MSEAYRFQYPLDATSLVLDVGAYRGDFARAALEIWGCEVISFEPIRAFYLELQQAASGGWSVFPFGLGAKNARVPMSVRNDSSSVFTDPEHPTEDVEIKDVLDAWHALDLHRVDLMKINIEGGEFDLIDRMAAVHLIPAVRFFQIQFHGCNGHGNGPHDAAERRVRIEKELELTHDKQWEAGDGIWVSWARR